MQKSLVRQIFEGASQLSMQCTIAPLQKSVFMKHTGKGNISFRIKILLKSGISYPSFCFRDRIFPAPVLKWG